MRPFLEPKTNLALALQVRGLRAFGHHVAVGISEEQTPTLPIYLYCNMHPNSSLDHDDSLNKTQFVTKFSPRNPSQTFQNPIRPFENPKLPKP